MEDYNKAPFTYEQQLSLLKSRGLKIDNPDNALIFLKQVNYYRITAYCIPFQKPHDVFLAETTFEAIVELYRLDEELRNAVFAMLSPIEIFVRTQTAYELSHGWGSFAHYDLSIFQNEDNGKKWIVDLEETTKDSKEPFLQHYLTKYNGFPRLPLWIACEIMSMGNLSSFYSYLKPDVQRRICEIVGVDHNVFKSWLYVINFLRNICAHHGRLWSRNLSISPMILDKNPQWQNIKFNNKKLFASVAIAEWVYRKAGLQLRNVEPVYEIMRQIAALNPRFTDWMGVPVNHGIGMCWEVE
ncbi:MAG: Abi family protein [Dehalococcoidales bacterium]|nr:Abi family protein [Dehalococcoidales bacterium]